MQHSMRGFLLVGLLNLGASACTAHRPPSGAEAPSPHTMQVILHDHLAFGVRLEHVSLLLDGSPAYEVTSARGPLELATLRVAPGAHTLTVLAEASEPCGLFEEPRMRLTVRALQAFLLGEGPGALDIDLYASTATSDPAHMVSVRFAGDRVALGAKTEGDAPPLSDRCEPGDELCALDARIEGARSRGDTVRSSCYASHRGEMRRWKDMLEDSFAAVSREGVTTSDAESAQLRARYAESRLRSIAAVARACEGDARVVATSPKVERKVDAVCPASDVTASREGW